MSQREIGRGGHQIGGGTVATLCGSLLGCPRLQQLGPQRCNRDNESLMDGWTDEKIWSKGVEVNDHWLESGGGRNINSNSFLAFLWFFVSVFLFLCSSCALLLLLPPPPPPLLLFLFFLFLFFFFLLLVYISGVLIPRHSRSFCVYDHAWTWFVFCLCSPHHSLCLVWLTLSPLSLIRFLQAWSQCPSFHVSALSLINHMNPICTNGMNSHLVCCGWWWWCSWSYFLLCAEADDDCHTVVVVHILLCAHSVFHKPHEADFDEWHEFTLRMLLWFLSCSLSFAFLRSLCPSWSTWSGLRSLLFFCCLNLISASSSFSWEVMSRQCGRCALLVSMMGCTILSRLFDRPFACCCVSVSLYLVLPFLAVFACM